MSACVMGSILGSCRYYWDLLDVHESLLGPYWGSLGSIGCLLEFTDAVLESTGAILGPTRVYWESTGIGILGGIC